MKLSLSLVKMRVIMARKSKLLQKKNSTKRYIAESLSNMWKGNAKSTGRNITS